MKGSRVQVSDSALDRETVAHATVFLFNVCISGKNEGFSSGKDRIAFLLSFCCSGMGVFFYLCTRGMCVHAHKGYLEERFS